jgi:hypothetical protein
MMTGCFFHSVLRFVNLISYLMTVNGPQDRMPDDLPDDTFIIYIYIYIYIGGE